MDSFGFVALVVFLFIGFCIRQAVKTVEESPAARQAALGGLSLLLKMFTKR